MSQPSYCLDTNSILVAWNDMYRPKSFSGFWRQLESLIDDGRAVICEEVERELGKKDDDAYEWVKAQSNFVVPLNPVQAILTKALVKQFPGLAKERLGRMRADGFVIALAQWKHLTVVTHESRRGPDKVPNICEAKNVECIPLADMIERENWSFA